MEDLLFHRDFPKVIKVLPYLKPILDSSYVVEDGVQKEGLKKILSPELATTIAKAGEAKHVKPILLEVVIQTTINNRIVGKLLSNLAELEEGKIKKIEINENNACGYDHKHDIDYSIIPITVTVD